MPVAVLAAAGVVPPPSVETLFLGELSLDGSLRHTTGVLPMVALARERRISHVVVPFADAADASLIDGVTVLAATTLAELAGPEQLEARARTRRIRAALANVLASALVGLDGALVEVEVDIAQRHHQPPSLGGSHSLRGPGTCWAAPSRAAAPI